jgi:hypothetical protein
VRLQDGFRGTAHTPHAWPIAFAWTLFALALALATCAPRSLAAQEGAISPPAPLQFPVVEKSQSPNADFSIRFLRTMVETGANEALCIALMTQAHQTIPPNFQWNLCPAPLQAKVLAGQGDVHWSSGAKPSQCGTKCVGRPFVTQSTDKDRPNTVYAMLFGHLNFGIRLPATSDRSVDYGYQAQFRCDVPPGQRTGKLDIRIVFGQPVVSAPGLLESIQDFALGPANLTRAIDAGIRRNLSRPATVSTTTFDCSSIGVHVDPSPSLDLILFNKPAPGSGRVPSHVAEVAGALRTSATIHLHSITRRPPPFNFTPAPAAGEFTLYFNGVPAVIPNSSALALPVAGGTAPLNMCRTVDLSGSNRLQVIFANSNGGATWSQYSPSQKFGAGTPHRITTGRTVVVAAPAGSPAGTHPQSLVVREYELLYTIDYAPPPELSSASSGSSSGGSRPPRTDRPDRLPTDATTGTTQPSSPCRTI